MDENANRDNKEIIKSVPLKDPKELWAMTPDNFNKWRQENDLPILFGYFKKDLPYFEEWLHENFPQEGYLLKIIPTAKIFDGQTDMSIVEYSTRNDKLTIDIIDSVEHFKNFYESRKDLKIDVKKIVKFIPYILWAKRKLKKKDIIKVDKLGTRYSDCFEYNMWSACDSPKMSRASLHHDFQVLKLGGIKIRNGVLIGGRNLDFTDLDFLTISGGYHGSIWSKISYSSARNLHFCNGWHSFYTFKSCAIDGILFSNSRLQDFEFINIGNFNAQFDKTELQKIKFINSLVSLQFNQCEIRDLEYKVPKGKCDTLAFNNYRKIRTAFQNVGKRQEAKHYYYLERCYEILSNLHFIKQNSSLFPPKKRYSTSLIKIFQRYKSKQFDFKESCKHLWWLLLFHLKIIFVPKYLFRAIVLLSKITLSIVEYFLWGFGERPCRILLNSMGIILFYAFVYFHSLHADLQHSLLNSLYFSITTFTTLGYGDISPKNYGQLKIVCGSEALLGAVMMGLLIVGLANRSKY